MVDGLGVSSMCNVIEALNGEIMSATWNGWASSREGQRIERTLPMLSVPSVQHTLTIVISVEVSLEMEL